MTKRLVLIGSALFVAVAVAAATIGPGHTSSPSQHAAPAAARDSARTFPSTSPRDPSSGVRAGARAGGDALMLHVVRSYTAHRIDNPYVASTANGIYLIIDVSATNPTGHSVLLNSGEITLELGGARYSPSAAALTALDLTDHATFSNTELEPSATGTGWVAFDVAPAAVDSSPQLCLAGPAAVAAAAC
jgi:Domain of unknown function (DUF4352)